MSIGFWGDVESGGIIIIKEMVPPGSIVQKKSSED